MVTRRRPRAPRWSRIARNAAALRALRWADAAAGSSYAPTASGVPVALAELWRGCVAHNPYRRVPSPDARACV